MNPCLPTINSKTANSENSEQSKGQSRDFGSHLEVPQRVSEDEESSFRYSYEIPQCGEFHILICNPNKTPIESCFMPFNLRRMEAGRKNFIRFGGYEMGERRSLKWLVDIKVCSSSSNRYYLHEKIGIFIAIPKGI